MQIKWWEYLFLSLYFVGVFAVGIVFKSGFLILCNVVLSVISNFLVAKGLFVGNVFGIINGAVYCTIAYFNHFYGEIVSMLIITIPSYCLSLYTWGKTKKKGSQVLSVNKGIGKLEWILAILFSCALAVGIYFLLQAFGTANLIVSTISTTINMFAGYLIIRRSEINFLVFVFCNIINIVLWLSSVSQNNLSNLPIICVYFLFVFINSFGFYNWIRLKNKQNKENNCVEIMISICKNDL